MIFTTKILAWTTSRAITELKQELMERAEEGVTASGGGGGGEDKLDGGGAATAAAQRQRVAELNARLERMARQLKSSADREVASLAQVKSWVNFSKL